MQRPLRVSLVIPAYNEESHIAACLDAVATQAIRPFEVIVVDNNSTDATVPIARSYDFVSVVHEPRQGLVFARDAGFDAAGGDVIGRIDADTLLPGNWIATVQRLFEDPNRAAVSGSVDYYDIPLKRIVARIDLWFRAHFARKMQGETYLYGSNMAIRRSTWRTVRGELCHAHSLHEDLDLAAHLASVDGIAVGFDAGLRASVSARCVEYAPRSFYRYMLANPRTYAAHGLQSQRCMYELIAFLLVMYFPLRFLYRASDPRTGRFSLRYLFVPAQPHLSPLTEPPLL